MRWEMLAALGELPSRQREALWDAVMLDRPRAEIAADLGCSVRNVDYLVEKAKGRLALTIERYRNEVCCF